MTKHFTPPNLQKHVRHKGSALLVMVIVLAIISSMIGLSLAKIGQAGMSATASNTIATEAQKPHENRPPFYALHYIMKL